MIFSLSNLKRTLPSNTSKTTQKKNTAKLCNKAALLGSLTRQCLNEMRAQELHDNRKRRHHKTILSFLVDRTCTFSRAHLVFQVRAMKLLPRCSFPEGFSLSEMNHRISYIPSLQPARKVQGYYRYNYLSLLIGIGSRS